MERINTISYDESFTHEYDFPNFTVHIEMETRETAHIRFKNEKGSFIDTPRGVMLRYDHNGGLKMDCKSFRIVWHGEYTLLHNQKAILKIRCPRQQTIDASDCTASRKIDT